ncbi:transporter substrate-binding domain-containing protein [Roseomonas stagni]|uniref:Transporter substrate-binding domain-containing protein n=1 Tax=Falsiroseomonas algicola TaxID=2716930 RepID=A0A6M1LK21_9PROT|nr:transporter substrate-binding domain-containing protein [Falsiroseomonas algicola]NGM20502.1 transporter substrate-binding domain-containing protein [Falsiroseomonas algicola]
MALPAGPRGSDEALRDPFNTSVATLLADQIGVACEIVPKPATGAIPALMGGEGDIVLPTLLSRRNAGRVLLAQPHAILDAVVISALRRPLRGPDMLAGLRVGLLASHAFAFGDDAGIPHHAVVTRLPDLATLEEALLAQEVEAALLPMPQARALASRNPGAGLSPRFTLRPFTFAPALRFGEHDLRHVVNAALAEALHDGTLAALFRREIGLPLLPLAPL